MTPVDSKKERQWKRLRVIVEVSVPPKARVTEKDLRHALAEVMPDRFLLPRPTHPGRVEGKPRLFLHSAHWAPHARAQGWRPPTIVKVPQDEDGGL